MKLSAAIRNWIDEGCPPQPDNCLDMEDPSDPHTACCSKLKGHGGKHADRFGSEW